ncbi:MAG: Asp-tRNA(Asn)/Glu-tRNA(Gln) amidotransferase subunit GatA [Armatimonadetes bacterium]|nr:Asp-tRNA(Asn)/Glu-tRNA(Gln) amidotransferase subunit GatA [Armatimonadota bacterium]
MSELYSMTARQLSALIAGKKVSCREAAESVLGRIEALEDRVKSYITRTPEMALEQADAVDRKIAAGEPVGPLAGIPIAVKDNFCTKGVRTTCASKILANWVPPYDATVVTRLKEAQAVILGKTNLDEFAMGSSTENSAFFQTHNPWDLACVPGGSSGGSAAAVAADECILATGSDTGGSIRQPAAFCGVVGIKPTYGRVSRYGLVAFASSLDQIGPLTKDVSDCALLMNAIAGHDPKDSTAAPLPVPDYTKSLVPDVEGLRIGVPKEFFAHGMDPEVSAAVRRAIDALVESGASAEETSMPHIGYTFPVYYILAPSEASSNLARYDGVRFGHRASDYDSMIRMFERSRDEGFGPEVKHRIMIGTYALSAGYYDAYYLKALKVRTLVKQDFDRAWERFDVLLTPTSPTVAFRLGEKADDPLQMKLADVCTIPVNMAGVPALAMPCGFQNGLPIGLQIIGRPFDEETIFRTAYTYEQHTEWHKQKPNLK